MAQRGGRGGVGGKRQGSGRPRGARSARTLIREAVAKASQIYTAQRVLEELAVCGFSDIGHYLSKQGSLLDLDAVPGASRRAISSLKVTKYNKPGTKDGIQEDVLEIRLWPKLEALVTLARHHGLLVDRVKVESDRPLRDRVAKARARLAAAVKK